MAESSAISRRTGTSPLGTLQKLKPCRTIPKRTSENSASQRNKILQELKQLPELIKKNNAGWKDGTKDFQLQAIRAQALGQDVLVHAATGSGKTGIAAAPHLLPLSKGNVTLVISPLLALQDEQVFIYCYVHFRCSLTVALRL